MTVQGSSVGVAVTVINTGDLSLRTVTIWVNGASLGTCSPNLLPDHFADCDLSATVSCAALSGGFPYSMKAEGTFQDGQTAEYTWNESPTVVVGGC